MKRLCLTLLLVAFAFIASGQLAPTNKPARVMVAWDANPELDVAGYKVYDGTNSRSYQRVTTVTNQMTNGVVSISTTNCIITNFVRGITHYFAATAFNTIPLESDFSEEATLFIPAPPSSPGGFEVTNELVIIISAKLEKATDPAGPWGIARIDPRFYVEEPAESSFFRMDLGIDLTGAKEE